MLRTANNLNEVVFLTAFLLGDMLLVASFVIARFNWRPDVPPFSLKTRAFDVLFHPANYVKPNAVRITRTLQVLGGLLLVVALLALARQAIQDFSH